MNLDRNSRELYCMRIRTGGLFGWVVIIMDSKVWNGGLFGMVRWIKLGSV